MLIVFSAFPKNNITFILKFFFFKADGVFSFERKSENSHFTFRKPSNLSNPPAKKAKYDTSDDDSDDTSDSDDEDNIIKSIEKLEKRIKLLKKLRELKIKLFLARKKK